MNTTIEHRTGKDPVRYIRKLNEYQRTVDPTFSAEIVSIDGKTKSGRTRYTVRLRFGQFEPRSRRTRPR